MKSNCGVIKTLVIYNRTNVKHYAFDVSNLLELCTKPLIPSHAEPFIVGHDATSARGERNNVEAANDGQLGWKLFSFFANDFPIVWSKTEFMLL